MPEYISGLALVMQDVADERIRQDAQWGGPAHDDTHTAQEWAIFRRKFERQIIGEPYLVARRSLLAIAALAVAQIEALDRAARATRAAQVARAEDLRTARGDAPPGYRWPHTNAESQTYIDTGELPLL